MQCKIGVLAERRAQTKFARHEPEKTILYRTIQNNFETLVSEASRKTDKRSFPRHVFDEVEAYLGCGILAKGFVRLQCESCKDERLVAFSCKKRGFCPSCGGRRTNEVAANLTETVFPKVPFRQWVISFPFSVRYALAYKPEMVTRVLTIYIRAISTWYRKAARKNHLSGETGTVTFIQRFGSAINLNVHFHSLFVDGVFSSDGQFHQVFPPADDEIGHLAEQINLRVTRFLKKNGFDVDDFSEDPLAHEQPVLALIGGASIQSRIGLGDREGRKVRRVGDDASIGQAFRIGPRCAVSDGFSIHANVQVKANERDKLEKLWVQRFDIRGRFSKKWMSQT